MLDLLHHRLCESYYIQLYCFFRLPKRASKRETLVLDLDDHAGAFTGLAFHIELVEPTLHALS